MTPGQALKQAIHVARARTELTADTQLARKAGVHYDTLMNWYGDKTVPRPAEVKRVADALGIPYSDLMAAYEGTDPAPQPLQDAIRDLITELRLGRQQQADATLALLQALESIVTRGRISSSQ